MERALQSGPCRQSVSGNHRDLLIVDDKTIEAAKTFFQKHGVKTAGGITFTIDESNQFETFSYSNPEHRRKVQEIAELTARHFDEFILDDFFFTSAKSEYDVKAKGDRSWTQYRLQLMADAARDLVVGPAKKVNPKVKVVIKYPNWYDHFQALGFNLEKEPSIFDGIYTGTETRDPVLADHICRRMRATTSCVISPTSRQAATGEGGSIPAVLATTIDMPKQLWLTLLAKAAPEVTMFDIRLMHEPLNPARRAPWQDQATSFDYDALSKPLANGGEGNDLCACRRAGVRSHRQTARRTREADGFEELQTLSLGRRSVPAKLSRHDWIADRDLTEFPEHDPIVLLTAQAADDPKIVDKIEKHVHAGNTVVITSGLLKALQGRGIERIAEIEDTGRVALVKDFKAGRRGGLVAGDKAILIPQIGYNTNDSWELVLAIDGDNGWPLLHDATTAKGHLMVLTIPENFADFYHYPEGALNADPGT